MQKVLLTIFIIVLATSQALCNQELLDTFLTRNKEINSFQATFEQRNYWPESDMELFSYGHLYTKKDKIMLDFYAPTKQVMLGTEDDLRLYFPEKDQLIIQDWSYWQNFINPELLAKEYLEFCNLESTKHFKNVTIFKFKPAEVMSDFKELIIQFSNSDSLIQALEYKDQYNNEVGFYFTEPYINTGIPDDIFTLPVPENTTIIDQRTTIQE